MDLDQELQQFRKDWLEELVPDAKETHTEPNFKDIIFDVLHVKWESDLQDLPFENFEVQFQNIFNDRDDNDLESLRKALFWIDSLTLSPPKNDLKSTKNGFTFDPNKCYVKEQEWDTQLTNIPWSSQLIRRVVGLYLENIPTCVWDHDIVKRVLLPRYRSLFADLEQCDLFARSIVESILTYSVLIAQESGAPVHFNNPSFRVIIKTKHNIILSSLMNDTAGDTLVQKLLKMEGGDGCLRIAFMSRKQMLPKFYEQKIRVMLKRTEMEDTGISDPHKMDDGFYECRKCKKFKTRHYSMQIRSADEPMTTFIRCYLCHSTWKE